jgi:hypothetical protein
MLTGPDEIYVIGSRMMSDELGELNEAVNREYMNLKYNYHYDEPNDPERLFYRSDHFNYAQAKAFPSSSSSTASTRTTTAPRTRPTRSTTRRCRPSHARSSYSPPSWRTRPRAPSLKGSSPRP